MIKYTKFKAQLDEQGWTGTIIEELWAAHQVDYARMKKNYDRYEQDATNGPPILSAEQAVGSSVSGGSVSTITGESNRKAAHAFDVDIVEQKIGYFLGSAISYEVDKTMSVEETKGMFQKIVNSLRKSNDDAKRKQMVSLIEQYRLRNDIDDQNAEWGKTAAVMGYGARLVYVDTEGFDRAKTYDDPYNVVFVGSVTAPSYAMYRYAEGENVFYECYDSVMVKTFSAAGGITLVNEQPHLMTSVPLFGLLNNASGKGDAERIYTLIDAYDALVSDVLTESEKTRLAYLVIRSEAGIDDEDITDIKKNSLIELTGEKDEVKFLTKNVNNEMIERALDRLEKDIYRLSQTPNMSEVKFGTSVSGTALRFRLQSLENKAKIAERKMTTALRYEMKLLFSMWAIRHNFNPEDYLRVFFTFKRNIPVNLLEEAQALSLLSATHSQRTVLGASSLVDDVDYELEQKALDTAAYGDAYTSASNVRFGQQDSDEEL